MKNIKTEWDQVTVLEFQQLNNIIEEESQFYMDKEILIVQLLSDYTIDEINKMPYTEFQELLVKMNFINTPFTHQEPTKTYKVKDKTFKINLKMEEMTTEQYIDLTEAVKNDITENIHVIVGCVCKSKDFESDAEKAEWIQDNMPITMANDILLFFCHYSRESIRSSLKAMTAVMTMKTKLMRKSKEKENLKDFLKYSETFLSLTE